MQAFLRRTVIQRLLVFRRGLAACVKWARRERWTERTLFRKLLKQLTGGVWEPALEREQRRREKGPDRREITGESPVLLMDGLSGGRGKGRVWEGLEVLARCHLPQREGTSVKRQVAWGRRCSVPLRTPLRASASRCPGSNVLAAEVRA